MKWTISFVVDIDGDNPFDQEVCAYLADAATAMAAGAEAWVAPRTCTIHPEPVGGLIALSWTGSAHAGNKEDIGIVQGLVKQADWHRARGKRVQ